MPDTQLSMSPRTQAFQMQQTPEDEDDLFTKGFTDLAYKAIAKSNPDLMADIITFRVIDTDASVGTGVGAFILKRDQDIVFIPCVVSDNAVKPLDVFYSRRLDRFYPLSKEWLNEANKGSVNQLGTGVQPPKSLPTDVDIRNLVVPPTTGRYSYASEQQVKEAELRMLIAVQAAENEKTAEHNPGLLEFLTSARNCVKIAASNVFTKNKKLAKIAAELYGAKNLLNALELNAEKTADDHKLQVKVKHQAFVATNATPMSELKSRLGDNEAKEAYKQIRIHGFYVKDDRKDVKDVFSLGDDELTLTTPDKPGVYKVFTSEGKEEIGLVISPKLISTAPAKTDEKKMIRGYYIDDRNRPEIVHRKEYLVVLPDGRWTITDKLIAEPVATVSHDDVVKLLDKVSKQSPSNGDEGCFISCAGLTLRATERMRVKKTSKSNEAVTVVNDFGDVVVQNLRMHGNKVVAPPGERILVISGDYHWVNLDHSKKLDKLYSSPTSVYRATEFKLEKQGAEKITIKKASEGFMIGKDREVVSGLKAVEKLANTYGIRISDSANIVKVAALGLGKNVWAVKLADGEQIEGLQDPSQAAAAGPPQPSGVELALAEKMQQVQGQMAALQQMQQMLQELQGRAQGIDQGGGAMAAPQGAAAMAGGPPGGVNGQPAMQPVPGMSGSGQQPQQPPQQPPPDPNQPPPPPPVMTEDPTPENIEQQVNPQFLNDAGVLQQKDIFDAAAISSLSQQPGVKDLVQTYMPTLEKALDNVSRILILYYLKENDIKENVGNDAYIETEQKLRDVVKGLGEAILKINGTSETIVPNT